MKYYVSKTNSNKKLLIRIHFVVNTFFANNVRIKYTLKKSNFNCLIYFRKFKLMFKLLLEIELESKLKNFNKIKF